MDSTDSNVSVQQGQVNWSEVEAALRDATVSVQEKNIPKRFVTPGAVLLVGIGGEVCFHRAFGSRSLLPMRSPMDEDTVFDLGSLTKVIVPTTLAMHLVDKRGLDLDRRLSMIFQTFGTHGKERMTIRHLLAHCSGYAATAPFYRLIAKAHRSDRAGVMNSRGAVETIYNEIFRARLDNLPGKVTKYSDLGFILLAKAMEDLFGMTLDKLAVREVFKPLGMRQTGYIDLSVLKRKGLEAVSEVIAPTGQCNWRHELICGEVYDENAWAMGGVAGHAGLFSSALDLYRFSHELLEAWHGRSEYLGREVVKTFWRRDTTVPDSERALGWDTPSEQGSSSGQYFSSSAVGHLGHTGCSLWLDPERELSVILLTNRVHPNVDNPLIEEFRPHIHDLIMEALGFAS